MFGVFKGDIHSFSRNSTARLFQIPINLLSLLSNKENSLTSCSLD